MPCGYPKEEPVETPEKTTLPEREDHPVEEPAKTA